MSSTTSQLIERGLHAWTTGDLDSLQALFDPAVTLRSVAPGEWDCVGREELMWLLRQRQPERAAHPITVELVDEHTIIVTSTQPAEYNAQQPLQITTRISVAAGKIIAVRQQRSDRPGAALD